MDTGATQVTSIICGKGVGMLSIAGLGLIPMLSKARHHKQEEGKINLSIGRWSSNTPLGQFGAFTWMVLNSLDLDRRSSNSHKLIWAFTGGVHTRRVISNQLSPSSNYLSDIGMHKVAWSGQCLSMVCCGLSMVWVCPTITFNVKNFTAVSIGITMAVFTGLHVGIFLSLAEVVVVL